MLGTAPKQRQATKCSDLVASSGVKPPVPATPGSTLPSASACLSRPPPTNAKTPRARCSTRTGHVVALRSPQRSTQARGISRASIQRLPGAKGRTGQAVNPIISGCCASVATSKRRRSPGRTARRSCRSRRPRWHRFGHRHKGRGPTVKFDQHGRTYTDFNNGAHRWPEHPLRMTLRRGPWAARRGFCARKYLPRYLPSADTKKPGSSFQAISLNLMAP